MRIYKTIISGTTWKLIEAPKSTSQSNKHKDISAKAVSVNAEAAWVVLSDGSIAVRTNVTQEQQHGKQWKLLQGALLWHLNIISILIHSNLFRIMAAKPSVLASVNIPDELQTAPR